MSRWSKVIAVAFLSCSLNGLPELDAQTLGNPGQLRSGSANARYPHLIQTAQPTNYNSAQAAQAEGQPVVTDTIIPSYDGGGHCLPLIPTLTQGVRDALNCLFPCRDGSPLGLGLGQAPRRGLFSVRFHESFGCGHAEPGCGCGHSVIYEGTPLPMPTPAVGPTVDPPKPLADPSAYYGPAPSIPAAYRTGLEARPQLIQTRYQRPFSGAGLPHNPLR